MKTVLITAILFAANSFFVENANAEGDRKVLRDAAGKYKGEFKGVLKGPDFPAKEFIARGFVEVPARRGSGLVALATMGMKSRLPVKVTKAMVRQGGNKVVYRGKDRIPAKLSMGHGRLRGSFSASVMLKGKNRISTRTRMGNGRGSSMAGSFKGSDEELQ